MSAVAVAPTGRIERLVRNDGKILKPEGFVPPEMSGAI